MRRPGAIAAATAALLIVLGLPFTAIKFTGVDASVLGTSHSARVVDDALRAEFPPNRTSPVIVAARAPASASAEVAAYAQRLSEIPGVLAVQPPQAADGLWRIGVVAPGRRLDESAKATVRAVRAVPAPFPVQVGGSTAEFLDQQSALADRLPVALAILALTTLVILFLMTGSVVLPVKTLIMNLLTLSAAFGILKLIFQDGRLEGLLGYTSQGALESSQPILLFAIAFGLSTDYGVFLITRIKEARDGGLSNDEAVAVGLQRTGRIVTAAAILHVHRHRRLRDLGDDLHQAARAGDRARRADRRDDRARAARAVADGAAGRVELVGAEAAGAPAPAVRAVRGGARVTLAPPHPFDADTALEPAGDGRWSAWAPEHWFVARGPNGGFLAALAARAAEAAAGRPLRSLTLHFLAPPAVGALAVGATVERERRHLLRRLGAARAGRRARHARPGHAGRAAGRRAGLVGGDAPAGAAAGGRRPGRSRHAPASRRSSATTSCARRWARRRRPAAGSGRPCRARWTPRWSRRWRTRGRRRRSPPSAGSSPRRRST